MYIEIFFALFCVLGQKEESIEKSKETEMRQICDILFGKEEEMRFLQEKLNRLNNGSFGDEPPNAETEEYLIGRISELQKEIDNLNNASFEK